MSKEVTAQELRDWLTGAINEDGNWSGEHGENDIKQAIRARIDDVERLKTRAEVCLTFGRLDPIGTCELLCELHNYTYGEKEKL